MSSIILKMDGMAHKFEWVAWVMLVGSLGLGLGQAIESAPSGDWAGRGYKYWDVGMTVMVFASAIVQGWTQVRYPRYGTRLERFARWLMFCVSTVFAFRFFWMIYTNGDIYAPPITIATFFAYCIAQMAHCIAITGIERE